MKVLAALEGLRQIRSQYHYWPLMVGSLLLQMGPCSDLMFSCGKMCFKVESQQTF